MVRIKAYILPEVSPNRTLLCEKPDAQVQKKGVNQSKKKNGFLLIKEIRSISMILGKTQSKCKKKGHKQMKMEYKSMGIDKL